MTKLNKMLTDLADLKEEIAALEESKKELESKILEYLNIEETTSIEWEHHGKVAKATAVYSTSLKFDEAELEKVLGPRKWREVSKRVLDPSLLEDQVARGRVDVGLVAKNTTEVPRKPYIKVTIKK